MHIPPAPPKIVVQTQKGLLLHIKLREPQPFPAHSGLGLLDWHVPLVQIWSAVQVLPQLPQFWMVVRSVQVPTPKQRALPAPQTAWPAGQAQAPLLQLAPCAQQTPLQADRPQLLLPGPH